MMTLNHVPRTTTREDWAKLARVMRKFGEYPRDPGWLEERAELKATIDRNTIDGKIGVVESGRDCDCVEYCHGRAVENLTVMKFTRDRDSMYEWADGPCYMSLCRPDELPETYQRDLAMEAHENGHPHVVYSQYA